MTDPALRLRGYVRVRITSPDTAAFLDRCVREGVILHDAAAPDELTCLFTVSRPNLPKVRRLAERLGCRCEILSRRGAPELLRRARRSRLLAAALLAAAAVLAASSLFVWDVRVTENDSQVSAARILRVLDSQGISPGSFWPSFRTERIRTRALLELPELSFLSVNVRGGRAEVEARAAVPAPEIFDPSAPGEVTARRAGIVESILVLAGEPRVSRGQAVTEGQLLIASEPTSPRALGEIRAYTYYELTACAPLEEYAADPTGPKHVRFALALGGKRINFYFGSGILPPECVKITRNWTLCSENAFSLPVSLVRETWQTFEYRRKEADLPALRSRLEQELTWRLAEALGERGEILENRFTAVVSEGRLLVTLRSKCLEHIEMTAPGS